MQLSIRIIVWPQLYFVSCSELEDFTSCCLVNRAVEQLNPPIPCEEGVCNDADEGGGSAVPGKALVFCTTKKLAAPWMHDHT